MGGRRGQAPLRKAQCCPRHTCQHTACRAWRCPLSRRDAGSAWQGAVLNMHGREAQFRCRTLLRGAELRLRLSIQLSLSQHACSQLDKAAAAATGTRAGRGDENSPQSVWPGGDTHIQRCCAPHLSLPAARPPPFFQHREQCRRRKMHLAVAAGCCTRTTGTRQCVE